ncbi:MAG: hypothetical protein IPJ74_24300 [Saprospiraceae bacterium]|nr:hypothetical protein [Saprospiraceae bacterium]
MMWDMDLSLGWRSGVVGVTVGVFANNTGNNGNQALAHLVFQFGYFCYRRFSHTKWGHQFSAQHTWSNCPAVKGNSRKRLAYEPGAGSTIMSYSNACGDQNFQGMRIAISPPNPWKRLLFLRQPNRHWRWLRYEITNR